LISKFPLHFWYIFVIKPVVNKPHQNRPEDLVWDEFYFTFHIG